MNQFYIFLSIQSEFYEKYNLIYLLILSYNLLKWKIINIHIKRFDFIDFTNIFLIL